MNDSCRSGARHGLASVAARQTVTNSTARNERTPCMVLAALISLDLHASGTSIASHEP